MTFWLGVLVAPLIWLPLCWLAALAWMVARGGWWPR